MFCDCIEIGSQITYQPTCIELINMYKPYITYRLILFVHQINFINSELRLLEFLDAEYIRRFIGDRRSIPSPSGSGSDKFFHSPHFPQLIVLSL